MILLYFWKFSKIRWRVFRLQKPSRNHSLHLQLRGNNTPPNYVIDYRFPLQTWKKVNSLLLTSLNNQLFRRHSKKKAAFFCNKRVKSVQGDSSNVTKSIACQSCITEKNMIKGNFVTKWNQVHEWTFARSLEMLSLIHAPFTDPCFFHWSGLLSHIRTHNWMVHTENALKCPANRFWMNACWLYRTPQIILSVNNY